MMSQTRIICEKCRRPVILCDPLLHSDDSESKTCLWTENNDHEYWESACGRAWTFEDSTPKKNGMKYCCYCGKSLRQQGARGER